MEALEQTSESMTTHPSSQLALSLVDSGLTRRELSRQWANSQRVESIVG